MTLGILTHSFNESLLLQKWVDHHSKIADSGIVIDHGTTDDSIKDLRLPDNWEVIKSNMVDFQCHRLDQEVLEIEQYAKAVYKQDWTVTLCTTEFIFTPDFKNTIEQVHQQVPDARALGMRSVCLVDPVENNSMNLLDHSWGYVDYENDAKGNRVEGCRRWRFIHNTDNPVYEVGRHGVGVPYVQVPELLLLYCQLAPYPLCRDRKLAVQTRIPQWDKDHKYGFQHLITEEGLTELHSSQSALSFDLNTFPLYKQYAEWWKANGGL